MLNSNNFDLNQNPVILNNDDIIAKKARLKEIIAQKSFKKGNFILASGATSNYLFDIKNTMLDPEGANLAADLILNEIEPKIDAVGGLELGACPIVSAICVKSYLIGRNIRAFYVRKAKKERGSNKLIEGCQLNKDDKIIIIEDVTTTGGSAIEAIKIVQNEGGQIVKVFSIVDRLEGARENFAKIGIKLQSLFTRDDFI